MICVIGVILFIGFIGEREFGNKIVIRGGVFGFRGFEVVLFLWVKLILFGYSMKYVF